MKGETEPREEKLRVNHELYKTVVNKERGTKFRAYPQWNFWIPEKGGSIGSVLGYNAFLTKMGFQPLRVVSHWQVKERQQWVAGRGLELYSVTLGKSLTLYGL